MDFIKHIIGRVISEAFLSGIGVIIRTCWIVFSSGFTTSFMETFKEVKVVENSYTNRIVGYTFLSLLH